MEKTGKDKSDGEQKAVTIRSFSFIDLANNFNDIEKKLAELGEDASEDYLQLHEMAKHLLAGKLDEVWKLKRAIESHNEALKAQLDKNNEMLEQIDFFVEQAVMQSPDKCIEGLTTKAKIQRNSRGSVIIHDESQVPDDFKQMTFDFSKKFPVLDRDTFSFLASFVLGRVIADGEVLSSEDAATLEEYFSVSVSKSDIEKKLKAGEQIPGVEYRVGHHLRFDAGKVKIKAPKE